MRVMRLNLAGGRKADADFVSEFLRNYDAFPFDFNWYLVLHEVHEFCIYK
jgi:hypothetical protein